MEHNGIWKEQFTIPAYMVDVTRHASLTAICNILQDMAGRHAKVLKVGYYDMQAIGCFWALNRLKVSINQFPKWQETINIETWISSARGPFSHRNFLIYNEKGELLGSASYLWFLVNIAKRRPTKIPKGIFSVFPDLIAPCGLPDKIKPKQGNFETAIHHVVYSNLDMIGHVNNVKYIEWILDSSRKSPIFKGQHPTTLTINYLSEIAENDTIMINRLPLESATNDYFYALMNADSDKVACRAVVSWA